MQGPEEYQSTNTGMIPVAWSALKVRDVCKLINGRGFKPYEWSEHGLPIVRIQNLNGSADYNYFTGNFDSKILIEDGQLLFAWSGSRGTSFGPHIWRGPDAVLNYHTWKIVPNEIVTKDFLYYALKGLTAFIEANAHGASALVHTQKWEMEGFHLAVPPLNEQRAISEALLDIDHLISSLDELISKKQAVKQGMMQQLLAGKTRLSGFVDDWTMKSLGDIAIIDPETLSSGTNSDEVIDYIALEDVSRGVIGGKTQIAFGDASSRARRIIREGDVLFGTVRPNLQSHALYSGGLRRPIASTGFAVVRALFGKADPHFLKHLILSDLALVQVNRIIAGSNYPAISSRDVRGLTFSIPTPQEQVAIGEVLGDVDSEIQMLRLRLSKARAVKEGMMQELLTGHTRLSPANAIV